MLWKRYNKRLGIRVWAAEGGYKKPFQHSRWMAQPWPNEFMPNISNDVDTSEEAIKQARSWYAWYCAVRCAYLGNKRNADRYTELHCKINNIPVGSL